MSKIRSAKSAGIKLWMIFIFILIPFLTFAQDPGDPCDDMDPLDNTCPLDSRVNMLILFLIVTVFAVITLRKKAGNKQALK